MMTKKADLSDFRTLIETIHRLRAPGGCPWDMKQTHHSLRPYVVEEAFEVLDVLDEIDSPEKLRDERVRGAFREELGDLLMQVLIHSELASETGAFDAYEVAKALNEKLIRRHPHVFGDAKADTVDSVLENWERIKAAEKAAKEKNASILDGTPKGLPSLARAARVIDKVTRVGFQWPDLQGPLDKVEEEFRELRVELEKMEAAKKAAAAGAGAAPGPRAQIEASAAVTEEIGDLLFSLCNVAFVAGVNPEDALRAFLAKFEGRFRHVEARLREGGKTPQQSTLEEMDRYWDEAKRDERARKAATKP